MEIAKFYLFYIPLFVVLTVVIIKHLNNKETNEERLTVLKWIAALGIVLHLIKPLFFPYNGQIDVLNGNPNIFKWPAILRKITIENVSAATTMFYLPVLMSKKKPLLDYMTIIGFIGGFLAIIYPAEVILQTFDSLDVVYTKNLFSFDTVRFYVVHYIPLIISFSLMYYRIHTLDLKRRHLFSLSVVGILAILFVNEWIIYQVGWLDDIEIVMRDEYGVTNLFYERNYRNFSFVFGIPDSFKGIGLFIDILVPGFMKTFQGQDNYIPVIWIIGPAIIYGPLLYSAFYYASKNLNYFKVKKIDHIEEVVV